MCFECASISWQASSHVRHSSAHRFITGSCPILLHSSAQCLQASAQAVQIRTENGPTLAVTDAALAQMEEQSWHVRNVVKCSFAPSASIVAQCAAHVSHSTAHLPHSF